MNYALIDGDEVVTYPYSYAKHRALHPDVSFPREVNDTWLADNNIVAVESSPRPDAAIDKNVTEGTPALVDGVWTQVWTEVDASAKEIAQRESAAAYRSARQEIKTDAFVENFIVMTPSDVTDYINANVTNLASAKSVINKLALMVLLLARREFTD